MTNFILNGLNAIVLACVMGFILGETLGWWGVLLSAVFVLYVHAVARSYTGGR